ncbi:SLA class II histocompatibility antigen, DQ haplotype D beta chain-like [Passerculus sandwichensis]
MGRGAAAGALLVALVVLGAPPAAGAELSAVFLHMGKQECYFINGTEKVRSVERLIYNREQYLVYDSDVGLYVGFNPYGAMNARRLNNDPMWLEYQRTSEEWFCRVWYEGSTPFITERRVSPPARPFKRRGQQELSEHVVATDVLPNGDWTYQLLVLLETPPRRGLS